jgi:hypothetical protein
MAQETKTNKEMTLDEKIESLRDPEVEAYIRSLKGDKDKPTLSTEEVRELLDRVMGDLTLSDVLFEMREKSF